jgi:hypothetical protein
MFFPNRIQSVRPGDRVLQITCGDSPHPRADVLLTYDSQKDSDRRSNDRNRDDVLPVTTDKPTYAFCGDRFPFADKEFDYAICSQVLQRVDDVGAFIGELTRVAHRGYVEFPTAYYDYLYDFREHPTLVFVHEGTIHWMPKSETCLPAFRPVTAFFYQTLVAGQKSLVDSLKDWLFQGFEWQGTIPTQRTHSLYDVCYPLSTLEVTRLQAGRRRRKWLPWPSRKRSAA